MAGLIPPNWYHLTQRLDWLWSSNRVASRVFRRRQLRTYFGAVGSWHIPNIIHLRLLRRIRNLVWLKWLRSPTRSCLCFSGSMECIILSIVTLMAATWAVSASDLAPSADEDALEALPVTCWTTCELIDSNAGMKTFLILFTMAAFNGSSILNRCLFTCTPFFDSWWIELASGRID